jgi:hypothetical protein
VDWLTSRLFTTYSDLHRVEATTRSDNAAMQAVFARCGHRREGTLREAWKNADGTRHDALVYAVLRPEWIARARGQAKPSSADERAPQTTVTGPWPRRRHAEVTCDVAKA